MANHETIGKAQPPGRNQLEAMLESVVDAMPAAVAVLVWNPEGDVCLANHFARDLLGLEARGQSVYDLWAEVGDERCSGAVPVQSADSVFSRVVFERRVLRFDDAPVVLPSGTRLMISGSTALLDAPSTPRPLAITAFRDVTAQRHNDAIREAEARVLELVAAGTALETTLQELTRLFEAEADGMQASILLVRDGKVQHAAAPSLPSRWAELVNGEPIGPNRGSCGTAAYLKQAVIVSDIATDPRWEIYRDAALSFGFRACWSIPILTSNGDVVGTFAFYYNRPRPPTAALLAMANRASRLASIAIMRHEHSRELLQSREHLARFYENSADPVFQLDAEAGSFRFGSVNPAFLSSTGLAASEVVGRWVEEIIPEPSLSMVLAKYEEAIQTRRTVRWEETTSYPTGERRGDVSVTPVFDSDGNVRHLVGSVRDVTERVRLATELHALLSREQLHSVLRVAPSNVAIVRDGSIRYANARFVETFGLDVGDDPTRCAIDPLEQRRVLDGAVTGKSVSGLEFQARSARGEVLDLLGTYRPIQYEDEPSVLVYAIDVSPLKRAERAQQALSQRLLLATQGASIGVWTWDLRSQRLEWDEVMCRLYGKGFDDRVPTYDEWRACVHLEDVASVDAAVAESVRTGRALDVEFRIRWPNRAVRHVKATAIVQRDSDGDVTAMVGTNWDITDIKATEAALRAARDASDAANRAKSAFLANMSHEIRTPMNAILGFGQLLAREPELSTRDRERVGKILSSGEHLLELINQVLDMSKIEAGRMALRSAPFDLHEALRHVEAMVRGRFEEKGLSLAVEGVAELPRFVSGDAARLRQTLLNLLGNAAKFTNRGGAVLRARSSVDRDITLRFEVEDTGVGIASHEVAKVFEPFGQLDSGFGGRSGTGLGVPISRDIARLMGGDLTLRSDPGRGSTFELVVRVQSADDAGRLIDGCAPTVLSLADGQTAPCILVVDDNADNRLLLCDMLLAAGVSVAEAATGESAITRFFEVSPDLVFMDVKMPGIDGLEATRRIRARDTRDVPIVALSASVLDDERSQVYASGCDRFIAKPVREAEIWAVLEEYLGLVFVRRPSSLPAPSEWPELTADEMTSLDVTARARLRESIELGDLDQFTILVEQLGGSNTETTSKLIDLAHRYQIDTLLSVL